MKYLVLFFLTCCTLCHGQQTSKVRLAGYYDKDWNKVDSASAYYYRTAEDKIRYYIIRNYFKSGKLQMEAEAMAYRPKLILNGHKTEYYENGAVKEESNYKRGYPDGLCRSFYEDGKLEKEVIFADNITSRSKFNSYYSSDGTRSSPQW